MKTPKTPTISEKKTVKTPLGGFVQKKKTNGLTPKNTPKSMKNIPDAKGALGLCNVKVGDGPKSPAKKGKGNAKKGKVISPGKPSPSLAKAAGGGQQKKKQKRRSKKNIKSSLNGAATSPGKTAKVSSPAKGKKKNSTKKKDIDTWSSLLASTPAEQQKSKLESQKVDQAVKAFKKYLQDLPAKSKELFNSPKPVFLQVSIFKIPKIRLNMKIERIPLPHPYLNNDSDICFFVSDVKRGKEFTDKSEEHYKEILEKNKIKFVNEIMPLKKYLSEYSQHEMKAKLCDRFDAFIVDAKVSHRFIGNLGKCFLKKRKVPVPVKLLDHAALQKNMKAALTKTALLLNCAGQVSIAQIGHSQQTAKELSENIISFTTHLSKILPGGWDNIKALNIKTDVSEAIPVYYSMKSPNEVSLPEIKKKKVAQPVEGDLSTIPGAKAVVYPSGEVILKKDKKATEKSKKKVAEVKDEDDSDDGLVEFSDDDDEDDESVVESDEEGDEFEIKGEDDGSSDEEEVDLAEKEYLKEWQDELSSKKMGGKRKSASSEEDSSPSGKKAKASKGTPQVQKQGQGKHNKGKPNQPKGPQNQQKGSPGKQKQPVNQKAQTKGPNKGAQQNGKGPLDKKSKKYFKPNKGQKMGSPGFNKQQGGSPKGGKMNKGKKGNSPGGKGRR